MASSDGLLWDVLDEHLHEAVFAAVRWRAALASPLWTLDELARGPEEQLVAHVDAMGLAGPPMVDRLVAALDGDQALAASLALLALGRQDLVWAAVSSPDPAIRAGAVEAFCLSASPSFESWLPGQLQPGVPMSSAERVALLKVAGRRGLRVDHLKVSLEHGGLDERIAAAVAARRGDPRQYLGVVEGLVDHEDAGVREAALVTALIFGSGHAWQRCVARAADGRRVFGLEMLLVALLGEPSQHAVLIERLELASHRGAALRALGYCGQAEVVDTLLEWSRSGDERTARLAGEAFAVLTGVDVEGMTRDSEEEEPDMLPPLDEDDLDAGLVAGPEDDLPLPRADALATAWAKLGPLVDRTRRVLGGQPWTLGGALAWMSRASLRARGPVSLWLQIRSAGAAGIEREAWTFTQRAQLAAAGRLTEHALVRRFGGW